MQHRINDIVVDIEWEQVELGENHGSGCKEWLLEGSDDDGNIYTAIGWYQDNELTEVIDIEKI